MSAWPLLAAAASLAFAGASFFFALAESALFSLGKGQTQQLVEREPRRGPTVARLLSQPQDLLATLVLGNSFANASLVALGIWLVREQGWPLFLTLSLVLMVVLIGTEVIPKTLAVRDPERWALRVARPTRWLQSITRPARHLAQALTSGILRRVIPGSLRPVTATTDEDYTELLELGYQQGALGQSEKEIILQIIHLDRRTAREVMKPRAQMHALPDDLPLTEMIAAARRYQHRRLPLYDDTPDTIVGLLNTRQLLLNPDADLADAIEFPSFVPESINLLQLLISLQRQQRGLAVVLDEYGSTAGLISTEDILGSMIGRIRGEGEAEGFVMERLGPGRWRVHGTMRLEDFRREYPDLPDVPGVETLGGLMLTLAGVVPPVGHTVRFRSLRLTATAADERRVREIQIEVARRGEGGSP